MMRLLVPLLLFVTLLACTQEQEALDLNSRQGPQVVTSKIVGGVEANFDEFKSVVAVHSINGGTCSGNLVTKNTVLSAAHCFFPAQLTDTQRNGFRNFFYSQLHPGVHLDDLPSTDLEINEEDQLKLKDAIASFINAEGIKRPVSFNGVKVYPQEVEIHQDYVNWIYNLLFSSESKGVDFSGLFDLVKITLPIDLEDSIPIPLISSDELSNLTRKDTFVAVGYGAIADIKVHQGLLDNIEKLEDYLKKNSDRRGFPMYQSIEQRHKKLEKDFDKIDQKIREPIKKRYVELHLREYRRGEANMFFSGKKTSLSPPAGTCYGDSGGPIFLKFSDGTFRQVGVISALLGPCGVGQTIVIPVSTTLLSDLNHERAMSVVIRDADPNELECTYTADSWLNPLGGRIAIKIDGQVALRSAMLSKKNLAKAMELCEQQITDAMDNNDNIVDLKFPPSFFKLTPEYAKGL